ncbi:MAG: PIN domain-containing protein [Acidobacteriota bacterium]|nr:PIN domain-containing protein [Acidobacteriota bacterium]
MDTSVAVPLLVAQHAAHAAVVRWWNGRTLALSGHALAESYSVLTRLPGDLRLAPADAALLLHERFAPPLMVSADTSARLIALLAEREIAGGAAYDALVGLAARDHDVELGTRDARARATYDALGVRVVVVGA